MILDAQQDIDNLLTKLSQSPTGRELVKFAKNHNVKIEMVNTLGKHVRGMFYTTQNTIYIVPRTEEESAAAIITLAHELRHAWQHHNGLLDKATEFTELTTHNNNNLDSSFFTLFHEIFIERRFAEADAFATSIQVIYEIAKNNTYSLNYMKELKKHGYPCILGASFDRKTKENIQNADNGLARRAAFDSCFKYSNPIKMHARLLTGYDDRVIGLFKNFNIFIKRYIKQSDWQKAIKNPQERKKLKDVFNTSAKDVRNQLPDINYLNKFGYMETGGNYLSDHAAKSLHSDYYMGSNFVGNFFYNRTWKKLQKTAKKVYNYKI